MQHWFILAGAIVLEVAGTTSMKLSQGFTRLGPSVLIFVFYGLSFVALTLALKKVDVGVAYAIWAGLWARPWSPRSVSPASTSRSPW